MSADNPFGKVVGKWEAVVEDMEATAEEYRDAGWEPVTLHPGDVTVVPADHDQFGLSVLAPDDEFDTLREAVAGRTFDSYEVYRGETESMVFLLVVVESDDDELAVFVPTYYERTDDAEGELRDHDGTLYTRIRNLAGDDVVSFSHDNPEPFFPEKTP